MGYCVLCSRHFASKEALEQHKQHSPVHNKKVHCQTCDCFFGTEEALEQHRKHSVVHNKTFHCQDCNQSYGSNKRFKDHRRFFQAASNWPSDPVDAPLSQGRDESAPSNIWPRSPISAQSLLLERLARMFISTTPPAITTHSQIASEGVLEPTQDTREFFMFPELHPEVRDAILPELSSTWFNDHNDDDNFDHEWFTHVMGRFICNNNICRKQFWDSRKVPIEIRGYDDNGYSAIVYNQRCKSCDQLGTFELDERSYIERVAYRLKKWAGVEMEAPPFNGIEGPPHERAYCEGCKRGKCREGDGFGLY